MKDKIALSVFVCSLIALAILIPFEFFNPSLTGKVINVEQESETAEVESASAPSISCSDSDNLDYFTKGVARYCNNGVCSDEYDSCSDKKLTEWYCENNQRNYKEYLCEFACDNGKCINLVKNYKYVGSGSSGGGGGGGGSSEVVVTVPVVEDYSKTYNLGEIGIGQSVEASGNDKIVFIISGNEYTFTLTKLEQAQAEISYSSQKFTINVGEEKSIDLNGDSISDVFVKLKSVNSITNKAEFFLRM